MISRVRTQTATQRRAGAGDVAVLNVIGFYSLITRAMRVGMKLGTGRVTWDRPMSKLKVG